MSDRKYRQSGYQDSPRGRSGPDGARPRKPVEPHDPRIPRDPRAPSMPGFHEVFRCSRCGARESLAVGPASQCSACGADLHTCGQCTSFDPGARLECREVIAVRVTPKDARNTCPLFSPGVKVERQTGSTPAAPSNARKAFDDLFKF